ncbi:MAG: LysM peptidoglycan-binding domain-containing protein [Chloroflexi bacterium]|nr:LysM peptidoglycan-binding domain-containing protein [Chloroflexota bacterium]
MPVKRFLTLGLLIAIGLGLLPWPTSAAPLSQAGENLVSNGGFEGNFVQANAKAQVGAGWTPWYIPTPAGQPDYLYMQPTYESSSNCSTTCDHRIHSGGNAQRMFQFFGAYQAGLYQQVNVPENADLRFTMFGQGWSSQTENPQNVSVNGTEMRMRIGIDPLGGTNPLDPRVQWSEEFNALDSWHQFTAYARAQGTRVTVFAYANPFDTRRKNEVYWDDAELLALSGDLAATAQARYPTLTPIPASQLWTPTPISVALGQNLLVDGGFEGRLYIPCSLRQGFPWRHIPCDQVDFSAKLPNGKSVYVMWNTVQVPLGWKAWWLTPNNDHGSPDYYSDHPANCYEDAPEGCMAWHNPEYRDAKGTAIGPSRIRSGANAQKYFTFWSTHQAGVFQTVSVPPGSAVRFSAYMHAWSSNIDMKALEPETFVSKEQTSMHMKVGIDPYGGDDPWSPNVVWSLERDAYDQWGYYEVRAVAQSDKVTVFTHTMPDKAMKHNDVYLDDAELVVVDGATAFSPPADAPNSAPAPQPAANVPAGPAPTALPRPDGALVHIVQSGDTVFGLALQYDVSMDDILQLNGLTKESYLLIGQELVIAGGQPGAAQPSPAASAAEVTPADLSSAAAVEATPTPAQIAAVSKTQLCVSAFTDLNGDGVLAGGEALADGAIFHLTDAQGQLVLSYMTDGQSEPHCFTRLKPGTFDIQIEPAAGTIATSDRRWSITLDPGATINVNFGSRASGGAAAGTTAPLSSPGDGSAAIGLAFLVIIAAAGWLMYRRQRTGARV